MKYIWKANIWFHIYIQGAICSLPGWFSGFRLLLNWWETAPGWYLPDICLQGWVASGETYWHYCHSEPASPVTGTNYSDITSVVTFYRTNPGHRLNKYSESWLQVLTKHQTVSLCSLFLSRCIHSDLWQFLTIRALFLLLLVSANGDDTVKLSSIITTFTRRKGANGVHEIVVDCWFSG